MCKNFFAQGIFLSQQLRSDGHVLLYTYAIQDTTVMCSYKKTMIIVIKELFDRDAIWHP